MAPGGEMFRYPQRFGENVLRSGSHEWLPYSNNEVRLKSSNTNLPLRLGSFGVEYVLVHPAEGFFHAA